MIDTSLNKKPSTLFLRQATKNKNPNNQNLNSSRGGSKRGSMLKHPGAKKKMGGKPRKKKKPKVEYKKKKSPFNKFLEKSDIVEIAIRAPHITDEEEMEIITCLYEHLATPTHETVGLYKLLIYYEQVQTFELLLDYRVKHNFKKDNILKDPKEIEDISMGRKDDDNIYDFDEIISDAFAYSIRLNKIHIAFYLFQKYEEDVYGNKILCIQEIFESFKNDDTQVNHVMFLEERLFILEKFTKYIEYKMGLEFLTIMHNQVLDDPKDNFLVY